MAKEFDMNVPPMSTYRDINGETTVPFLAYQGIEYFLEPFALKLGQNIYMKADFRVQGRNKKTLYIQNWCVFGSWRQYHWMSVWVCLLDTANMSVPYCMRYTCSAPQIKFLRKKLLLRSCKPFTKPHTGSPVKASDLKLSSKESAVNFDPRPLEFRNLPGYYDHFRGTWLNQPEVNSYPVSKMFKPANPYAVSLDLDYGILPPDDQWLQSQKIAKVSSEEIEVLTRSQSKSDECRRQHTVRLTSSSFGRICKATTKTNLDNLARTLTNPVQEIHAPAIKHGKKIWIFRPQNLWKRNRTQN